MPNTCRHSYHLNFELKIVAEAEAEAVHNNRKIAREYGISYLLEIVTITVIKKIVLGKYSPIRRTQTLAVIFSRN